MLIKILKDCKINSEIIQVICEIYQGDWTELSMNDEAVTRINVTGGVRQGCVLSPSIFNVYMEEIFKEFEELPRI